MRLGTQIDPSPEIAPGVAGTACVTEIEAVLLEFREELHPSTPPTLVIVRLVAPALFRLAVLNDPLPATETIISAVLPVAVLAPLRL